MPYQKTASFAASRYGWSSCVCFTVRPRNPRRILQNAQAISTFPWTCPFNGMMQSAAHSSTIRQKTQGLSLKLSNSSKDSSHLQGMGSVRSLWKSSRNLLWYLLSTVPGCTLRESVSRIIGVIVTLTQTCVSFLFPQPPQI